MKNKIVIDKKKDNIKKSICTSAGSIPKGCLIKKSFEKGICKVKYDFNKLFQRFVFMEFLFIECDIIGGMLFGKSGANRMVYGEHL